ncbi:MAG: hypothetical protein H0T69_18160 [Thermoleophilaceae bacterium]|nr:hypothetical protein [Thermoleophilaceae bacterium]
MTTPHLPRRHQHAGSDAPAHVRWVACASVVVLYIFLAALGAFEPSETIELTVVVVVLAALLLAHEWRGLFRNERR